MVDKRNLPKTNETKAKMSASRICRVLRLRSESEYEAVYLEQLERLNARDAVLAALENERENSMGVESPVG